MNSVINIVRILILTATFVCLLGFVDIFILSELVLPEDICFYHTHKPPFLMDFFYIAPWSNGHPEPVSTLPMIILIISLSVGASYLTNRMINDQLLAKSKVH
ncbi:MAG: hypothetical protein N4A46_14785 [Schleiferiaceae bacterium]|nr:hypothetical protein [Schleiferiaceae bacterium]